MEPLIALPRTPYLFGIDIETVNSTGKQVFLCGAIVDGQTKQKWFLKSRRKLIEQVIRLWRIHKGAQFYATSLRFDFFELVKNSVWEGRTDLLFRGSRMISGKILVDAWQFTQKTKTKIKQSKIYYKGPLFLDTVNIFPASVAELGTILVGEEKLPHPPYLGERAPESVEEWAYMQKYNIQDAYISVIAMKILQNGFSNIAENYIEIAKIKNWDIDESIMQRWKLFKGCRMRRTIASTALDCFKRLFLDRYIEELPPEYMKEHRLAYYGGRCVVFIRGRMERRYDKPIKCYDVNSMYPHVMQNEFPDPNSLLVFENPNFNNALFHIKNFDGVAYARVTTPEYMHIPYLPYRDGDGKLLFPLGTFSGWWSFLELRRAQELGYTIHRIEKFYSYIKKCKPFELFVKCNYEMRSIEKERGSRLELMYKGIMNNLYGRLFMNPFGEVKYVHKDQLTESMIEEYIKKGYELRDLDGAGQYVRFVSINTTPSEDIVPIWTLYVTAFARDLLYNYMTVMGERLIYVDTDSVTGYDTLKESKKLGGMKLEKDITICEFVRPKFYYYRDTGNGSICRVKGVPYLEPRKGIKMRRALAFRSREMVRLAIAGLTSFNYDCLTSFGISNRKFMGKVHEINEKMQRTRILKVEDNKRVWPRPYQSNDVQESTPLILNR